METVILFPDNMVLKSLTRDDGGKDYSLFCSFSHKCFVISITDGKAALSINNEDGVNITIDVAQKISAGMVIEAINKAVGLANNITKIVVVSMDYKILDKFIQDGVLECVLMNYHGYSVMSNLSDLEKKI